MHPTKPRKLNHRSITTRSVPAALLIAVSGAAAGDFAGYIEPVRWRTGAGPADVKAADADGDGLVDLVVINGAASTFTVLRGRGDGAFDRLADVPTVATPSALTLGDFTGDQRPDVAILSTAGSLLAVHVNNGDGTFGAAQVLALSSPGHDIVSADFNSDGRDDLFVAHRDARRLTHLASLGGGAFRIVEEFSTLHFPWCIEPADVNGDGRPDLGVGLLSGGQYNAIRILRNNGGAGFLAPIDSVILRQPVDLAFGDFNRDGVPDAATVDRHAGIVTSVIGAGDGSFSQQRFGSVNGQPEAIVAADMNNDGIDDVVSVHSYFNRVSTLVGLGDGGFAFPLWQDLPPQAMDVAAGDFDGDGFPDIAATHAFPQSDVITVLINDSLPGAAAHLIDVKAAEGRIIFGPVEDIERSDNVLLRARAEEQGLDLRVFAQSKVSDPERLNLTVESQINHRAGVEQVRLYNWSLKRFDVVMQHPTGLGDRRKRALAIDAASYVAVDGSIRVSIRYFVPVLTPRAAVPEAFVDWVEIAVE